MKLDRLIYGFSLVGLLGFYSCSSDEGLMPVDSVKGVPMPLTVTVNRGDVATRTELTENTQGGLNDKWLANDKLQVFDTNGKQVGVLDLKSGADTESAVFSGTVTATDGKYCLWYFGNCSAEEANATSDPYVSYTDGGVVNFNISNQSFKSTKELSAFDVMYEKVDIVVSGNEATVTKDVTMTPIFAMARFSLSGLGSEASGSLTIKDGTSESETVLTPQYSLATGERIADTIEGQIVINVTGVESGKDVYVALLPKAYSFNFSFTNTADSKVYNGKVTSNELEAGKYYCILPGSGETTLSGIPVKMTEEGVTNPYEGYENEDPRNPLHKFAKYNLVRVGDRGSLVNGFASSETENGALFQWGRNYGYMDTNGIYVEDIVSPNEDFTNFIDALGRFDDVEAEYDRTLDYYVYNPRPNNYFMTSGTAMRYTPKHPQYVLWYDSPNFYSTKDELIAHPDKYFMDGTPGTRFCGYGNYGIGMEQKNEKPDYWLSSFGDGGTTWEARAKNCGYKATNPCPDGWRMPTLEEFKAIAPEGQGLDANKTMASMLSNYAESRTTTDGINYAIRWIYDAAAITIEAVVTEKKLSKSEINSSFWDNNRDTKVVRVFPFTGSIVPLISLSDGYMMASKEYIVRPHNRGFLDYTGFPGGYGPSNNYYWMLIGPGDVNNAGPAFGGYWVSEKNYAFKFEAKEIQNGKNTSNSSFTATSCMFVGSAEPVMGYAIRPVMDIK